MSKKENLKKIITAGIIMLLGLLLFKYLPISIFGKNILFDASAHVTLTFFILYIIWFFIDQNKSWRIPYFILSAVILIIVAMQRILANEHNDIGIIAGIVLSLLAIGISQWRAIKTSLIFSF